QTTTPSQPVISSKPDDLYPPPNTTQMMFHETITDKDLFDSVIKGPDPPKEDLPVMEAYSAGEISEESDCQSEMESEGYMISEEEEESFSISDQESENPAFMADPAESSTGGYTTQQPADQPMGHTEEEYFGVENAT
ncbi:hypothetical protein ABN235_19005, partial [Morganella morganii]|uniref:hypothetical protein n=1 Tax=Morganella morganii TaxID=582 RepID=UPI0032DB6328